MKNLISDALKVVQESENKAALAVEANEFVLVRGVGKILKSEAQELGLQYEAFNPVSTYGMKGKSAQDMAGQIQRGPTTQEMIKATAQAKKHGDGHKMIGVTVGMDGKAQVKTAKVVTSVVGEPVKESLDLDEANNGVDHVTMTVPLLIRCLEWAHEDAKTDVEIHQFVEKIIAKGGVLETNDYEDLLP